MRYRSLTKNEGKTSYEVELDTEALQLKTFTDIQAFLLFDDDMVQESDDDVFEAGEDMEEDTQADEEEHYPDLKKFDNILPLTERQLVKYLRKAAIEGYYEENIDRREQTNKVIDAAMNSLDKNIIARVIEATEGLKSSVASLQADIKEPPSHTEGEHAAIEEEPTNAVPITTVKPTEMITLEVQPITTIISTSQSEPLVPQREGKGTVINDQPEVQIKLVPTSKEVRLDPDAPLLMPYEINGKNF
ncbi:hypothetical protein Tco_0688664 [Tanacetum coccineum]